ncbi:uncharacterized protein AB9W97_008620 [Spinachia spinachia]
MAAVCRRLILAWLLTHGAAGTTATGAPAHGATPTSDRVADGEMSTTTRAPPAPPSSTRPASAQTGSTSPSSTRPASAQTGSTSPSSTRPASAQTGSTSPSSTRPASAQTGSTSPSSTRPCRPGADRTTPLPSALPSTTETSTGPAEERPYATSPVAATASIHTGRAKESQPGVTGEEPSEGSNPGTAVAGLIGGALVGMMVGFLLIYLKKRQLQKQQVTTADWAGPSPFLEGDGQAPHPPSDHISLSGFLSQPDAAMGDMTVGSTFGGAAQETASPAPVESPHQVM